MFVGLFLALEIMFNDDILAFANDFVFHWALEFS